MTSLAFWEGVGVGLGLSAAGVAGLWWALRRRIHTLVNGPVHPTVTPTPSPHEIPNGLTEPMEPAPMEAAAGLEAGLSSPTDTAGPPSPTARLPAPIASPDPDLRLSQRVLLHVARQGVVGPHEVAPRALSQGGMVEALAVPQGVLTGVLRRLVAAEVMSERREHAQGVDRRVKVYRLTPLGEQVARDLRRRPRP